MPGYTRIWRAASGDICLHVEIRYLLFGKIANRRVLGYSANNLRQAGENRGACRRQTGVGNNAPILHDEERAASIQASRGPKQTRACDSAIQAGRVRRRKYGLARIHEATGKNSIGFRIRA